MNIFFYSAQQSTQATASLDYLKSLYPPLNIQELPSGLGFSSHEARQLRSGDLIVLFAGDQKELEALMLLSNECRNFKILLIFSTLDQKLVETGHSLNPRFYTSVDNKYIHVEEFIRNILTKNA